MPRTRAMTSYCRPTIPTPQLFASPANKCHHLLKPPPPPPSPFAKMIYTPSAQILIFFLNLWNENTNKYIFIDKKRFKIYSCSKESHPYTKTESTIQILVTCVKTPYIDHAVQCCKQKHQQHIADICWVVFFIIPWIEI